MKYILLFTAFIFALSSKGQKARSIDLSINFIKPDTNEIVYAPVDYPIKFWVKNLGPDTLKPNDIFRYYTFVIDSGDKGPFIYKLDRKYYPNEWFDLTHNMKIDAEFDLDFYRIQISGIVYNLSADSIKTEWTNYINNRPSVIVKVKKLTNSSQSAYGFKPGLTIYPNPTSSVLHFSEGVTALKIYNFSGTCVMIQDGLTRETDVSHLTPGLYLIRAIQNGTVVTTWMTRQ